MIMGTFPPLPAAPASVETLPPLPGAALVTVPFEQPKAIKNTATSVEVDRIGSSLGQV